LDQNHSAAPFMCGFGEGAHTLATANSLELRNIQWDICHFAE